MGELTRAERNIAWCERFLRIPDGAHVGKPLVMADYMREDFRAIYDNPHGTRQAIISRGRKNAKTTESAMIVLLHTAGPEAFPNSQLYTAAQSQDQAAVLYELAAKMVRMSPDLSAYIHMKDTEKVLICPEMGTYFKALSAEASTAFGKSPVLVIHDELGQVRGPRFRLYTALETAMQAHAAPMSIVISTQAADDGDLLSILIDDAKTGRDPSTVLRLHTSDVDADPFAEETIRQANPAYDLFMNRAEVLKRAENARAMPSEEAEYRNLILNQRVEVNEPYIAPAVWQANAGDVAEDWSGLEAFGGLDLSAANDLTAYVKVAWIDRRLHVRPRFWLPEKGLREKARKDRVPYDVWAERGLLETTPGASVDYDYVAPIILADLRAGVAKIGFDRWNMRFFRPALTRAGATEEELELMIEFGQGFQSMSPALRSLDTILLNEQMAHGNHAVLRMCAQNAVVKSDPAGNRKLVKAASTRRIDGIVALAMAVAMAGEPVEDDGLIMTFSDDYTVAL